MSIDAIASPVTGRVTEKCIKFGIEEVAMTKSTLLVSAIAISAFTMTSFSQETNASSSTTMASNASLEPASPEIQNAPTSDQKRANSFWEQRSITGEWGGVRSDLQSSGIQFEGMYKGEAFIGGNQSSDYLFNVDLIVLFDLNKIFGWPNASVEFYGIGNGGTRPSDRYVVAQSVSSIEATPDWRLYSANLQFAIADGDVSFLVGLYDLNSEFCTLTSAASFFNSSFGMGPEFAQAGQTGPSTFPVTSLGIRTTVTPFECWSVALAVLDGVPGDPNTSTGTHVLFNEGDGILLAAEIVYAEEGEDVRVPLKAGIGAWTYTSPFEDLAEVMYDGSIISRTGNAGIYGLFEGPVARHLSGFFRVGIANAHLNRFDFSAAGGINIHDLFQDGDLGGIGFSTTHNGWEYQLIADPTTVKSETVVELTYLTSITPWFAIQPDLQVFVNPDGNSTRSPLVAGGARFLLSF